MIVTFFLAGIAMATFAASGIFFYKFWRASHDRFFYFFSIACWLLSFERVVSVVVNGVFAHATEADSTSWVYLIRLFAFAMILVAILEKNRSAKK